MATQICQNCGATWQQTTVLGKASMLADLAIGAGLVAVGLMIGKWADGNYRWWGLLPLAWGIAVIINRKPWQKQRISDRKSVV